MSKPKKIILKSLKVVLWLMAGLVMLLLLVAGLVQLPSVQSRIVNFATSYVSNKTNTVVEIERVSISFPKSVVISGIYLEDEQKDTLLYAKKLKVNMAFRNLLSNNISVNSISLDDATVNLYSFEYSPVFNYNFLITAFADTIPKPQTAEKPESKSWDFHIHKLNLQDVNFVYNDNYLGINVSVAIEKAKLDVGEIDPSSLIFQIDNMLLDGMMTDIIMKPTSNKKTGNPNAVMPLISAKKLQITNSLVNYTDSVSGILLLAELNTGNISNVLVDLPNERIETQLLKLANSNISYVQFEKAKKDVAEETKTSTSGNDWVVVAEKAELENSSFLYQLSGNPVLENSFDPNKLQFDITSMLASDFFYSIDLLQVSVDEFIAIEQNGLHVEYLETQFSMDEHSISAQNLVFRSPHTSIDADFRIEYSSLTHFVESYNFSGLGLEIRNAVFSAHDLLYFSPELSTMPIFSDSDMLTQLKGSFSGSFDRLKGESLEVKTAGNTLLRTDFEIAGLSDIDSASFFFPNLELTTTKTDVELLAGEFIPSSMHLPENMMLNIEFDGQLTKFDINAHIETSFGDAVLLANIDKDENFEAKMLTEHFDLGQLMGDTLFYGPLTLNADASGKGLNIETMKAQVNVNVPEFYLNQYTYHNLSFDGLLEGKQFEGNINLNDEFAVFDFAGLVNIESGQEQFRFTLNLEGADLKQLNFTEDDIRISFNAEADFEGIEPEKMNGTVSLNNTLVVKENKIYSLQILTAAIENKENLSTLNLKSALADLDYTGSVSPIELPGILSTFINDYFPLNDSLVQTEINETSNFNFDLKVYDHPMLSEVLLPGLEHFDPVIVSGSFNASTSKLSIKGDLPNIVYGNTHINGFEFEVNSTSESIDFNISGREVSNAQFALVNILANGAAANGIANAEISLIDDDLFKRLMVAASLSKEGENYRLSLAPDNFFLMNKQWQIAPENYIEFGEQGFLVHNLDISYASSLLSISSVNERFNDDLQIKIRDFKITDISGIVEKDTTFVSGLINGDVLLKNYENSYGITADANISELIFGDVSIGNLKATAESPNSETINFSINLEGSENKINAEGHYIGTGGAEALRVIANIESLSMQTIEAFSMGEIKDATGILSGNVSVSGNPGMPDVSGQLVFNEVSFSPSFLNTRVEMKNETISFKNDGIYFEDFTVLDAVQNRASLNGAIKMEKFSNFSFALSVQATDFLLINTTARDNSEFFGRMIIDSNIDVTGPLTLPVVRARLKMKRGSNFTFVVPESRLSTDRGEDVVYFKTAHELSPILARQQNGQASKTTITGFDVSSIIEIDKEATLRMLMDPASSDSLVVKGEAALSFTMDRSGTMSLTGAYNLGEGSYVVSLESLVRKHFDIEKGSTIVFSGDPLDADINIDARYMVRTSPYDLIAGQMSGLDDAERGAYRQRFPFWVILKLRGKILQPEISFEIKLPPGDQGILDGAVQQRLTMLNDDPSALNKQVFSLLVLGRFVPENPLQSDNTDASSILRTTVSRFLSTQLNQLTAGIVPGLELDFDIQSYDDYQTGQPEGRTQVEIGVRQQLFNERLSVQLGGTLDVEGERARHNQASDLAGDVVVEYKLNEEGNFRIKGFRQNRYEGAIEGQLIETGVGFAYVRDFNRWRRLFGTLPDNRRNAQRPE